MIEYLQKLVEFYPETDEQSSVEQLLIYVGDFLTSKGMTVEMKTYDGIHNLYASTKGVKHSQVLLQGHIDVVPGKDQSFRSDGDKIFGRGCYDMLFGTASFMQLIDDISPDLDQYDLAIMLSGDEEHGGQSGVSKLLSEEGYTTGVCILPDAGNGFGTMNIGAKGVFQPTIRINGKSHHGSRPWEGDGAAGKLVRFLTELTGLFDESDQSNSTMTISRLKAGEAMNQGPATAEVGLDIRYKDKEDLARIQTGLDSLLKTFNGEILDVHIARDFNLNIENNFVASFIDLYAKYAGEPITMMKANGSSDARFFDEKDMPVIMFRPDGGGAHGDEEWLSLSGLNKFYELLKEYVLITATRP